MKKLIYVMGISLLACINLMGCSSRYTYTKQLFTTDENRESIEIDEMDTTIVIAFSEEYEKIRVNYCESKEVDEIRYEIDSSQNHLKIRKNDSTNGFAFHLGPSNIEEEIPELRIEIPKSYIDRIDILAADCSVKIIGGEIGDLSVKTSDYPIELVDTSVNNFTGVNKSGSIVARIIGNASDYTVKSKVKNGNNNLKGHDFTGQKQMDLETKDGDIEVIFIQDET